MILNLVKNKCALLKKSEVEDSSTVLDPAAISLSETLYPTHPTDNLNKEEGDYEMTSSAQSHRTYEDSPDGSEKIKERNVDRKVLQ